MSTMKYEKVLNVSLVKKRWLWERLGGINMIKTHCINFSKKKVKEISTFLSLAFPSPNLLFPNICPNFMSSFSEFSFLGVFCFLFLYRQVCMSMHHACANGKEGTGFFGNGIMNRCHECWKLHPGPWTSNQCSYP